MLGIICGLESEAVIACQLIGAEVVCAGARPQKARRLGRDLVEKGVTKIMSFGIAGALAPDLPVGSLVIGSHVVSANARWECDKDWGTALSQSLTGAHYGGVWGSEYLVPSSGEKRSIYEDSQCLIVDMESQCAAEIAAEAKLPLAVVRVVCDSAAMNVPPMVMYAINEDGSVNPAKALWSIIKKPSQIPDLTHMGLGTRKALSVLQGLVSVMP
jgi:hopanoid-associated phosphorylase